MVQVKEMYRIKVLVIFSVILLGCKKENKNMTTKFLEEKIPNEMPIPFKEELTPKNKIIHKGILDPEFKRYYYTISDKEFKKFDVFMIEKEEGKWSVPKPAFFNSNYSEHGMSFSPDGNTLYFSSTRPVNREGVSSTWHIWKSEKVNGKWSKPIFVDIPNLRTRLVSHPTITTSGTMYFHVSNLDYTNMNIYQSKYINGEFEEAAKVLFPTDSKIRRCTPFVSATEDYIVFAEIGNQLDLMISFKNEKETWTKPRKLSNHINKLGQGNPFITPDNKFLFFTTGQPGSDAWNVKWVSVVSELKRK